MTAFDVLDETLTEPDLRRRPHPVRRFTGWLLVLLVVAGALAWRYQPLTAGDSFGVHGSAVTRLPAGSQVGYAPAGAFDVTFSVRNAGLLPLRITSVPAGGLRPGLSLVAVRVMPPAATTFDDARASAFSAFALPAGASRVLQARYRFADCGAPAVDGFRIMRSQPVAYQIVARLRRPAAVPLVQPVVIAGLPNC